MSSLDYHSPEGHKQSSEGQPAPDEPLQSDESKLAQLKKLLMSDEQSSIEKLESRVVDIEESRALLQALRERIANMENSLVSHDELARELSDLKLNAEELSQLLPVAVRKASTRDEQLANSLSPTLANAFQESVQRNPAALADAVSPIMGPAIRRSISQAIAAMVQSLEQTLQHGFSPRGLKWRWEAMTTGKPFAEVVLLHSLIYLVEHVFLIRREDGVVMARVSSLPEDQTDPDLVSGMLTALQDFAHDSLGSQQTDQLEDFRVGDRNVFVEHGGEAIVAAVIRGYPPESIRETLKEAVEGVQLKYADELQNFDGDTDVFIPVEYDLRGCLQSAYHEQEEKQPVGRWWRRLQWGLVAVLMLAALSWLGLYLRRHGLQREYAELLATPETVELELRRGVLRLRGQAHDDWITHATAAAPALRHVDRLDTSELANQDQAWLDCLAALRDQPGILVTSTSRKGCIYYVEGLQDPLAQQAQSIIDQSGLQPGQVRSQFTSYHSMESECVMARVRQSLGDVETVRWTQDGNRLKATGNASHTWCMAANRYAEHTREIEIDVRDVTDTDRTALLDREQELEKRIVMHTDGTSDLAERQEGLLDEIAAEIVALMDAAAEIDEQVHVIVVGYTDNEESSESGPQALSIARSRFIWKELTNRGVPAEYLLIRGRGTGRITPSVTEDSVTDMRRCMFSVRLGSQSS